MKDTVSCLREGLYRNNEKILTGHPLCKVKFDCHKLWMRCLDEARGKFIPICERIEGTIGLLNVDEMYTDGEVNLPIDTLVVDLTIEEDDLDVFGALMEI